MDIRISNHFKERFFERYGMEWSSDIEDTVIKLIECQISDNEIDDVIYFDARINNHNMLLVYNQKNSVLLTCYKEKKLSRHKMRKKRIANDNSLLFTKECAKNESFKKMRRYI